VIAVFAVIGVVARPGGCRSGRQADQAPSCGRLSCAPWGPASAGGRQA